MYCIPGDGTFVRELSTAGEIPQKAISGQVMITLLGPQGVAGDGTSGWKLSTPGRFRRKAISGVLNGDPATSAAYEIGTLSVSQMASWISGIEFERSPAGISDEKMNEFRLPLIKFTDTTETVLRNLLVYEAKAVAEESRVLAECLDLMCAIVDTAEDVRILRDRSGWTTMKSRASSSLNTSI